MAQKLKIGIVGGTGYTGVELLRSCATPACGADARSRRARKRACRWRRCSRRCAASATSRSPSRTSPTSKAATSCSSPRRTASRWPGARARRRGHEDRRPRRRLPAQGRRRVRALVQDAARVPGPARRVGLWPAGDEPRRDPRRADRRQPGLSDDDAARLPAAGRGRGRRPRCWSPTASPASRAPAARPRSTRCSRKRPTTSPRTACRPPAPPRGDAGPRRAAKGPLNLVFTPHLTPMIRGIFSTLYAPRVRDVDVQALFEARYAGEPFVDVMPAGSAPDTRSVRASNMLRISVAQPKDSRPSACWS